MKRSLTVTLAAGALGVVVMWSSACATGASAVTASTYARASVYRSATAHVLLPPEQAFKPVVEMLLARGDIKITELDEADTRCSAVSGDHKLTLRVIESGDGRSRISILVGGGDDPNENQDLADDLIWRICARLGTACDIGTGES